MMAENTRESELAKIVREILELVEYITLTKFKVQQAQEQIFICLE
jgi:hypothetical protein